jgi:hypothetical protein
MHQPTRVRNKAFDDPWCLFRLLYSYKKQYTTHYRFSGTDVCTTFVQGLTMLGVYSGGPPAVRVRAGCRGRRAPPSPDGTRAPLGGL